MPRSATNAGAASSAGRTGHKILIVDDEAIIRTVLVQSLKVAGYEGIAVEGGKEALAVMPSLKPALVILDVSMPGLTGFETVERMRAGGFTQPVLMLTSFSDIDDRVRGFGAGADDYLTKPFHQRELLARVGALLRRPRAMAPAVAEPAAVRVIRLGDVTIDLAAKQAERGGVPLALTRTEFAMLECLASERGRPVSREHLLAAVWGYDAGSNTRTVETHIWRLRKKLGDAGMESSWLRTLSGLGYVLEAETVEAALAHA